MVKQHLKRLASPRSWNIKKKNITFTTRPNPGPHPISYQMPITTILRDLLGIAKTTKEVKFLLHNKDCLIDGNFCHDYRRPAGIMDVISIISRNENYRMLINKRNKLYLVKLADEEKAQKLCKISSKTNIKGNKTQLNFTDGRNILVDDSTKYSIGDSLLVELPSQKIKQHFECKIGAPILLISGNHVGNLATIENIDKNVLTVKTDKGIFTTKKEFAFVLGKDKPVIVF